MLLQLENKELKDAVLHRNLYNEFIWAVLNNDKSITNKNNLKELTYQRPLCSTLIN